MRDPLVLGRDMAAKRIVLIQGTVRPSPAGDLGPFVAGRYATKSRSAGHLYLGPVNPPDANATTKTLLGSTRLLERIAFSPSCLQT